MKAWKIRFRRFETFYIKGQLKRSLIDNIIKRDGFDVYQNWMQHCIETHGDIKQEGLL